jgi:hypothetical protein
MVITTQPIQGINLRSESTCALVTQGAPLWSPFVFLQCIYLSSGDRNIVSVTIKN